MELNSSVSFKRHILVCTNKKEDPAAPCCANGGSLEIYKALKEYVKTNGIAGVKVSQARCFSMCAMGPNMVVYPEQIWYNHVTAADVPEIISKYIDPFKK